MACLEVMELPEMGNYILLTSVLKQVTLQSSADPQAVVINIIIIGSLVVKEQYPKIPVSDHHPPHTGLIIVIISIRTQVLVGLPRV